MSSAGKKSLLEWSQAILVPVAIAAAGWLIQHELGQADHQLKQTEMISKALERLDGVGDPRGPLMIVAATGQAGLPYLIAILDAAGSEIADTLQARRDTTLALAFHWPIPDAFIAERCRGNPTYSNRSLATLNGSARRAVITWRAALAALKSAGPDGIAALNDALENSESLESRSLILHALVEMAPFSTHQPRLGRILEKILNGQVAADSSARADALTVLASDRSVLVRVKSGLALDLTCRRVPTTSIEGIPVAGQPLDAAGGTLTLVNTDFGPGTLIRGLSYRSVIFDHSNFSESRLVDVRFQNTPERNHTDRAVVALAAEFERTDLIKVDLSGSAFTESRLRGVVFRQTNLTDAMFDDAWLEDVEIEESDVSGASAQHVTIGRVRAEKRARTLFEEGAAPAGKLSARWSRAVSRGKSGVSLLQARNF
jgi:hypothetical protein